MFKNNFVSFSQISQAFGSFVGTGYVPKTGSKTQKSKKFLPKGVYFIVALILTNLIVSSVVNTSANAFYLVASFVSLVAAIGLISRYNIARQLMIGLSSLVIVLSIFSLTMLINGQQKASQIKNEYAAAIKKYNAYQLTSEQYEYLDYLSMQVSVADKALSNRVRASYFKLGLNALANGLVIFYLTRTQVKKAFDK